MPITLEPLKENQLSTLLELILALGKSDGLQDIKVTEQQLAQNLLSSSPSAFAKFIEQEGEIIGFIIHSWKWSPFIGNKQVYMQCIYIKPEFQGYGHGRQAMKLLAKYAQQEGCEKVEWLVISDNHQANQFYDSIGAKELSHLRLRRLEVANLDTLAQS